MASIGQQDSCWLVLALGLGLAGCRAQPESGDTAAITPPETVTSKTPVVTLPPGCDELGSVVLSVEPERLPLSCKNGHHECSGRTTLMVRSCAARPVEFHEVMLSPAPPLRPPVVSTGAVVVLEPGETWTMELELHDRGVYELSLVPVAASEGPPISLGTAALTVENPAREQAMVECRACNGDWGGQGMFGIEGCNCRTRDGGTPCDDGADCQAECIARAPEPEFRCSEFVSVWGCRHYLPEDWSKQRRHKGVEPPYVCVD